MNQSESIKDLAAALSKAQSQMRGALKDSKNPFFKSNYADLASCTEALREPLSSNGLSVSQTTDFVNGAGICVVTTLMHSSGQWIRGTLPIMNTKPEPQAVGSAITYARRYSLAAITGLVQVDDDAEAAHGRMSDMAEKHEVRSVTESRPVAMPRSTASQCMPKCETMLVSKFNPNELYCPKCKRKEAKVA